MQTGKISFVGSMIKKMRKEIKMSQERLGEIIGVSYQQIQKYENGTNRVSADMLQKIALALNVPVGYFFERAGFAQHVREEGAVYGEVKDISSDEQELVRCFRAIDDREYRKRFLLLLKAAAKKS